MSSSGSLKDSPAFIVFLGTVLGYALGFFFEWGHLSYYGIGYDYVQIKPLEIFFGVIVALFLMLLYEVVAEVVSAYDKNKPYQRASIEVALLTTLLVIIILLTKKAHISNASHVLTLLLEILGYFILLGWAFFGAIKEYLTTKKLEKSLANYYRKLDITSEKRRTKNSQKSTGELKLIPREIIQPFILILVTLFLCSGVGRLTAGYENKFVTVIKSDSSIKQIVIRDYGDQLLLKPFNTKTQELMNGFSIENSIGNMYVNTVLKCTNTFTTNLQSNSSVRVECPKSV